VRCKFLDIKQRPSRDTAKHLAHVIYVRQTKPFFHFSSNFCRNGSHEVPRGTNTITLALYVEIQGNSNYKVSYY
jgi:hypothetical protein